MAAVELNTVRQSPERVGNCQCCFPVDRASLDIKVIKSGEVLLFQTKVLLAPDAWLMVSVELATVEQCPEDVRKCGGLARAR